MRTKQIGARTYSLAYAYDANGEITAITYPSGHVVEYQRAADDRVTGVQARASAAAAPTPLASGIAWLPFGSLAGYTQGNGLTLARAYDGNYWLSGVTLSGTSGTLLGLTLTRDPNGRVAGVTDSAAPLRNASYG